MVKRRVWALVAWGLGALFLLVWLFVGAGTQWFGLASLWEEASSPWDYHYTSTWDPVVSRVRGLSIAWGHGPVEVRSSPSSQVVVTEYAGETLQGEAKLRLSSSRGVLRIQWDRSPLGLSSFLPQEKRLVVEVPVEVATQLREFTCENLSGSITVDRITAQETCVRSGTGDLFLSGLQGETIQVSTNSGALRWQGGAAQDLEVELGSGSGELVNVEAEACRLSTVSAPVTYTGSGRQMEVCTVSGPVRAELSACPEEGTFQAVSGSLEVALPENPGFEARCQSLSGTFVSEFPGKSAQGVLYGAGGPLLQFSTTSGDVHIQRRSGSAL